MLQQYFEKAIEACAARLGWRKKWGSYCLKTTDCFWTHLSHCCQFVKWVFPPLIIAKLTVNPVYNVCCRSLAKRPCMFPTQRIWTPLSLLVVTMATAATSRQLMRAISNEEFQHWEMDDLNTHTATKKSKYFQHDNHSLHLKLLTASCITIQMQVNYHLLHVSWMYTTRWVETNVFLISIPYTTQPRRKHNTITSAAFVETPYQMVHLHPKSYINMLSPRGMNEFHMGASFYVIIVGALGEEGRL